MNSCDEGDQDYLVGYHNSGSSQLGLGDHVYFSSNLSEIVPKFTLNFNTTNSVCVVDDLYCVKNISYSIHLFFIVIIIIIVIHSRESEYRTININSIVIVIVIAIINVVLRKGSDYWTIFIVNSLRGSEYWTTPASANISWGPILAKAACCYLELKT